MSGAKARGDASPGGASLSVHDLSAGYAPGVEIVRGVDLDVPAGSRLAILGANGAGKSTLAKAIVGLTPYTKGRVVFAGDDIASLPVHRRIGGGLAFVPQTENVFASLSILENLRIAASSLPRPARRAAIEDAFARFADLAAMPQRPAGALSGGQRQMLAIARALVVAPRAIVLDEPSAGLSPKIAGEVFARLGAVAKDGVTVIVVEQNVDAALAFAERAIVMAEGTVRADRPARDLADAHDLEALFFGRAAGSA